MDRFVVVLRIWWGKSATCLAIGKRRPYHYDFDLKEKNTLKKPRKTKSNKCYLFYHHGIVIKHD